MTKNTVSTRFYTSYKQPPIDYAVYSEQPTYHKGDCIRLRNELTDTAVYKVIEVIHDLTEVAPKCYILLKIHDYHFKTPAE